MNQETQSSSSETDILLPLSGSLALNDQRSQLINDVMTLADEIGPRNVYHYAGLRRAESYLVETLTEAGLEPWRQEFQVENTTFANIIAEIPGRDRTREIVVIGAHYDTHLDSPGANENASAVATLLALARYFRGATPSRTLRFVAFANEEAPFTRTENMGSRVYARNCKRRGEKIIAMLSLDSIGYCSRAEGSQRWSFGGRVLPRRGDFLALVANSQSRHLLERVTAALSRNSLVSYEGVTVPGFLPSAKNSDHWSFWQERYPALMVTDTAPLRYGHYHKSSDTPEKLDFEWLDKVVESLKHAIEDLVLPTDLTTTPELERAIPWEETSPVVGQRALVYGGLGLAAAGLLFWAFRRWKATSPASK